MLEFAFIRIFTPSQRPAEYRVGVMGNPGLIDTITQLQQTLVAALRLLRLAGSPRHVPFMLALVLLCAGCVRQQNRALDWYAEEIDLSDGNALIKPAAVSGRSGSVALWSWDCWMAYPARAKRLILNPGKQTLRVVCEVAGVTDSLFAASLTFRAEPGGIYAAGSRMSACIVVRDVVKGAVVARSARCDGPVLE